MSRWYWKRSLLAVVAGAAAALGTRAVEPTGGDAPPETIVLKTPGKPDQKVAVLRTTRRADGRVFTVVKDVATGQTFTLVDRGAALPAEAPPAVVPAGGSDRGLFKGKGKDAEPEPSPKPSPSPERKHRPR